MIAGLYGMNVDAFAWLAFTICILGSRCNQLAIPAGSLSIYFLRKRDSVQ